MKMNWSLSVKPGSLVTVLPARSGLSILLRDLPEQENNWADSRDGLPLGRLWELYDSSDKQIKTMYEKFIEVLL